MDAEFVKYLVTQGGLSAVALILFYFYRKDTQNNSDQWKGQANMLLDVVKNNTSAITLNTEVVRAFAQRLERMDDRNHPERYPAP